MSFEAEVIPLFIGGVLVVSSFELLIRSIFANWLNVKFDIASISNSTNIGLFGIFWCVSVMLIVSCIQECLKKETAD